MRGLYAIADVRTLEHRGVGVLAFAEAVLRVAPAALQLRAKDVPPREGLALLRGLAPMCHRAGVLLVANDRPDLAILAGCDLVHVGQTDMPVDRVRRIAPGIGVGISTHTLEQLDAALEARPAYVALGPLYPTSTKDNPDPVVSLGLLRAASVRARAAGVPFVGIGGVTAERARDIAGLVDAVAVVAGLFPPAGPTWSPEDVLREITRRAAAFQAAFAPEPVAAGGAVR